MSVLSPAERAEAGREARRRVPPEALAESVDADRPGALPILAEQSTSRLPDLVPIRHARMSASPFAFYRGGAAVMAQDLAHSPDTGLTVQLCGDAHLANFGMFASPERTLLFDINDFDETYPGPWDWDVKRLVASLVVAGRESSFSPTQTSAIVVGAVRRYREAMTTFASMGNLALWYSRVDVDAFGRLFGDRLDPRMRRRMAKSATKAQRRDHHRALDKLTRVVDGERHIISDPPLIVPVSELAGGVMAPEEIEVAMQGILRNYAESLRPGHRQLLEAYTYVDTARKVVGVGSVGTRCWIVLMRGRDDEDPLFLQVKEAQASVLQRHLGPNRYDHEGQRVVSGQQIMQAASDIFLGWHRTSGLDGRMRDFYVRQLHDWKGSASIETLTATGMEIYAELCAWTLARAHARSGDRIAIAAYLGDDDRVVRAMRDFAHAYADVNERDHAAFANAVANGQLPGAAVEE